MTGTLHRKLLEELSDMATIIASDGTITYVSPAVEQTLGYEPEDLEGEVGFEYQHPEDREHVADAIETLQTNPDEPQIIETRFRRADGSWCWIESTLQNRLDDPEIDGILVNSRDISERKRQEQRYQKLAEEYKTLLETVDDSIFFLTVESSDQEYEFRFERLNRAYEEQTGITTDEVREKTPREVFGDDIGADLHANYRRCVRARESISYEEELPVETGARFWQTILTPVITNGDVTQIIGITRNITERVKRERQLQNQKEQLDEFASVVSHDLRNPLNVAEGHVELAAAECDSAHLAEAEDALGRMWTIIDDTLTLAKHGQDVGTKEDVTLSTLLERCWATVETDDASLAVETDLTIKADPDRLRNLFENLIRNAAEHGSASGGGVTVRVGAIDGSETGFYVADDGPGISPEERDRVFDLGYTTAEAGTGYGLAIVKWIAEAHGWDVTVTDGDDGGARFEFTGVDIVG